MNHKTALKVYEIVSYVLIICAKVAFVFFTFRDNISLMQRVNSTFVLLVSVLLLAAAGFARMFMERERFRSCDEENDKLREDLRRLTLLLAEERKKNNNKQ